MYEKVKRVLTSLGFILFVAGISFGAGIYTGRYGNSGKPESNYIDSSVLERIREYQIGYIQTRYAELAERERLIAERESRFTETGRLIAADRAGYADIERLARETIKIINDRAKEE